MLSQPEIKHINALKIKKYRHKYSEFIAEGDKIIKELIDEGLEVVNIYTLQNNFSLNDRRIKIVNEPDLKKITALTQPHQSLAVFKIPTHKMTVQKNEWVLLLDDIQDPGNMGTIIRTCDWFGIHKIICSNGCVDAFNPKVVQASMASVGRVQIIENDLEKIIAEHKLPVYGAVLDGKNYHSQDFSQKGAILIGNEGHGIREDLLSKITFPITIPKNGKAESLNAAIATALILDKL
ncbi:MAG: RNA methyltransferase [Sphingobacteriales bacterium]|nr:RNA methyltransferase [Sphingobacteriales bacterium]